jgi:hypothetical protein
MEGAKPDYLVDHPLDILKVLEVIDLRRVN